MEFLTSTIFDYQADTVYKCIVQMIQCYIALKKINFSSPKNDDGSHHLFKIHKIYHNESENIFRLVEKLIDFINEKNSTHFTLISDNIDIIKYETGDFSNKHRNFMPVGTKYLSYYTLLFCIDANCTGGETSLYLDRDTSIDFKESITPGEWILFQNQSEQCRQKILSGYKIILKAKIAHINLSNYSFNNQFNKLVNAHNEIISDFLSKSENVLSINNFSEYVFYRDCFRDCTNVVPYQFIKCNSLISNFSVHNINNNQTLILKSDTDDIGKKIPERSHDRYLSNHKSYKNIIWFNVGNCCPLIYFSHEQPEEYDSEDEIVGDERQEVVNAENKIEDLIHNNNNINEIDRAISLMACYFWITSIEYKGSYDEPVIDFANCSQSVNSFIVSNIQKNLEKNHKQLNKVFNVDKLPECSIKNVEKKFTDDFVKKIIDNSKYEIINYSKPAYDTGSDGESSYQELNAKIYFGFVNL